MLKHTMAHQEFNSTGQPKIRVGRKVPSNSVNLAYYHNPKLRPEENISISDAGKLVVENVAQEYNNELIMYPDGSNKLKFGEESELQSDLFEVTNIFTEDGIPLYYCYKMSHKYFDKSEGAKMGEPSEDTLRMAKTNGRPLYGDAYKYIFRLEESEQPHMYDVYVYTSFLVTNASKAVCIYNAVIEKEDGYDISPGFKEQISPQPFITKNNGYTLSPVTGAIIKTNEITVSDPIRVVDTRNTIEVEFSISTDSGLEAGPFTGKIVNKEFMLPHEKRSFRDFLIYISPKENGVHKTGRELIKEATGCSDEDLEGKLFSINLISTTPEEAFDTVMVGLDAEGFVPPVGSTSTKTGVNGNEKLHVPYVYTEYSDKNYVQGYAVRMKDHRQIKILLPTASGSLENWYPRVQFGLFEQDAKDGEDDIKLIYTLPEYNREEYSFKYGKPYREVKEEQPVVINSHLLKVKHFPLHVTTEEYRIPDNMKVIKKDKEGNITEYTITTWNAEDGLIEVAESISDNETLLADYIYEDIGFMYRGYVHSDQMISIDLNPNQYHTFDKPAFDNEGNLIRFDETETYNMFNYTMNIFMKPALTLDANENIISSNETVLYHKFNEVPNEEFDILVGKVYLRHNTTVDNMELVDTRVRGGGVIEEIMDHVRKSLEPESDNYLDIGYWDGEPFSENAVFIVRVDSRILKANGGKFSKENVESAISRWSSYGSLPIIEYMKTFGEQESPNSTMQIEQSYSNIIEGRPTVTIDVIRDIELERIQVHVSGQDNKPYGILEMTEEALFNDKFIARTESNNLPLGDIMVHSKTVKTLVEPFASAEAEQLGDMVDISIEMHSVTESQNAATSAVVESSPQIDTNDGTLEPSNVKLKVEDPETTEVVITSDKYSVDKSETEEPTLTVSVESVDLEKE